MEAKQVKIEYWKETGKWYTSEEFFVASLDDIEEEMRGRFKGMTATVSYRNYGENYFNPYRMYKL